MKRFAALALLALTCLSLTAADNYRESNTRVTGSTDPVVLRSTDSSGIHTPHVLQHLATVSAASSLTATATNGVATVTIAAAGAGISNVVDGVAWSYSADPTGGHISVKDGSTVVFQTDLPAGGAGFFPVVRKGTANTAMTIVLSAGGSGIVGYVNAARVYTE